MVHKRLWIMTLLVVASLLLAACPAAAPAPAGSAAEAPAATEAPAAEAAATTAPAAEAPAAEAAAGEAMDWESVDPTGQEISFWHQHSGAREEALKVIVDEFNATNEYGIKLTAEYQGDYPEIFQKMLTILGTDEVPAVVVAYQNQAATYQLVDGLVDMNGLMGSAKWGLSAEDQKDFFQGFLSSDVFPNFGGARLGLAPNRSMEVVYYNMDWLKELGIENPPTTPDEFKAATCAAAKQPFSKSKGGKAIGYEFGNGASTFASWTFGFGGDIYDYTNNQYTFNSDASKTAATFLQDLFKEGCAAPIAERFGDQTDFGNGDLLFTTGSSSGIPFYASAVSEGAAFNWSVAAFPHTTENPVQNLYGASVSIPKSTPEKELAAWIFLKYYTGKDAQAKWAEASNYFPVRQSVAEGLTSYFEKNPAYKTAFGLLEYGHAEPPVPGYDFVRDVLQEKIAAIVGGADVATTLDEVNSEANKILEEQMAEMK